MKGQAPNTDIFGRVALLLGQKTLCRFSEAKVTILGLGAVGYVSAESLLRTGIKNFMLADFDILRKSNFNRHLLADSERVGKSKIDEAKTRLLRINPEATITTSGLFIHGDTIGDIVPQDTDIVIDAIDSLNPKVSTLAWLVRNGFKVVSCMGTAARSDPFTLRLDDISNTTVCPLAQLVRKKLRKEGITSGITCVYSVQKPLHALGEPELETMERGRKRRALGSIFYMTAQAGLLASYAAIQMITGNNVTGPADKVRPKKDLS